MLLEWQLWRLKPLLIYKARRAAREIFCSALLVPMCLEQTLQDKTTLGPSVSQSRSARSLYKLFFFFFIRMWYSFVTLGTALHKLNILRNRDTVYI